MTDKKIKKEKYKGDDKEMKARKGRIEGKKNCHNTSMISSDSLFFGKVTLQKESGNAIRYIRQSRSTKAVLKTESFTQELSGSL